MKFCEIIRSDKLKQKRAMTLVEVIITLALLSIVMTIVFSLNLFGLKVFGKGTSLSDLQFDVRMSSDFIFSEIRNASDILLETPASPNEYNKIFVDSNRIAYQPAGGTIIYKTDNIIQNSSTDLLFSIVDNSSSYMLEFTIIGATNVEDYSLSTNVLLNNIKFASPESNKPVLYYKKATLPTASPTPTNSPTPTISPTETPPIPTATPAATPTVSPILTAVFVDGTKTNTSVEIKFTNDIEDNYTPGSEVALDRVSSNILKFTASNVIDDKNYYFSVTDVYNVSYNVTVHYKNNGNKWDIVQVQ